MKKLVRWWPTGALVSFLLLLYSGAWFTGSSPATFWKGWGVPAMEPIFFDAHALGTWFELRAAGEDPHAANPLDPMERTVNYPPSVFVLGELGWRTETVPFFGGLLALLYVCAVAWLAQPRTWVEALWWTALVLSPAVLLTVERGNLDLLIFALLVLVVALRRVLWLAGGVLGLAVWWKFFPVAGLGAIWLGGRKGWPAAAFWTAVCAFMLWQWRENVLHARGSLQHEFAGSFGVQTVGNFWLAQGDPAGLGWLLREVGFPLALLLGVALAGLGFWCAGRAHFALGLRRNRVEVCAAWLGAPCFALLFLSGTQFDYKMIFLLLLVPLVLHCTNRGKALRVLAHLWLVLFLLSTWWMFFSYDEGWRVFFLKQGLAWSLFGLTAWWGGLLVRHGLVENFFARRNPGDLAESGHA